MFKHIYPMFLILILGGSLLTPVQGGSHPEAGSADSESGQPVPPPAGSAQNTPKQGQSPSSPHEEITVTATRTPQEVRHLGQSVSVITAADIAAQGAQTVQQVLEGVAGVNVVQTNSQGSVTSIFVRGGESDFNLVLLDGVPINQAGGSFDFGDLSVANVERIEIVRGPSSVLYGSDATSSTINIITRTGEGKPSGHFAVEAGSYDSLNINGSIQGGSERAHYSLGAAYTDTDGFLPLNSQYRRSEIGARGSFELSPSSDVTAMLRYSDSLQHVATDSTGRAIDPNDYRESNQLFYSLSYANKYGERAGTRLQYGYFRGRSENYEVEDGVVDFFNSMFAVEETRHQVDWQNDFRVRDGNLLSVGFSYEGEESLNTGFSRKGAGVFVQEQIAWNDRAFLTAGIRHERNDQYSDFTTGSFTAAFLVDENLKLRSSVGNGFRSPSFVEIVGFPSFGILGNPDLKPEKNVSADVGADYLFAQGKAFISTSLFLNRFSDLIEFSFMVAPGAVNYLNIEKARSQGLEVDAVLNLTSQVKVGSNYSLTETRVTDSGSIPGGAFQQGMPLLRRPRHSGLLFAEYSRKRNRVRMEVKFKGSREDIQFFPDYSSRRVNLDPYWRVDFRAFFPLFKVSESQGELGLLLRGRNLLNTGYTELAGFETPGRNLSMGVELSF